MKCFFLALFLLLTTACNRSELLYRFADTLAVSKTDEYFDLTSEQHSDLKEDIQKDLQRVRKEVFPQVAKSLRQLEPITRKDKLDPAELETHFTEFQKHFQNLAACFKDTAIKTSLRFSASQYTHFAKELRDEIRETEKTNADSQDAIRDSSKRYRRALEFWVGGLSSEQKDKLTEFLTAHPYPWRTQNQNKEFVLKQYLDSRSDSEKLKKFVATFFTDTETLRLPVYAQAVSEHKKQFHKFLIDQFWPRLSKLQKDTLRENLIARAEELEKIAQRP